MHDDKIEAVVTEYIHAGRMFTSVDVSDEVKKRGTFVRNRDVASWLRSNVTNYSRSTINVVRAEDGVSVNATLYHPYGDDPMQYHTTSQKPITPTDFASTHPSAIPTTQAVVPPVTVPVADPDPTGLKAAAVAFGRFNFPGVKKKN